MRTPAAFPLLAVSLFAQAPTVIQSYDSVKDSRQTINDNFARLANQGPGISSATYNFAPQSPRPPQSLAPGSNTIGLRPVPAGVNGSNIGYSLYISGGAGTAEACPVTGGTAVSGASSGTVIVSCANSHSGAWTVASATAGIAEAVNALPAAGGAVSIPAGTWNLFAPVTVASSGVCIAGVGVRGSVLNWTGPDTGNIFHFDGPDTPSSFNITTNSDIAGIGFSNCLRHLQIRTPVSAMNQLVAVFSDNQASLTVDDVAMTNMLHGIIVVGGSSQTNRFTQISIYAPRGDGVIMNSGLVAGYFDTVNIFCNTGNSGTSSGFRVIQDQGSVLYNSYTAGCVNGFQAVPGNGQRVALMQMTNTYFDCGPSSGSTGIALLPATGGTVQLMRFIGTTTACQQDWGVFIAGTGTVNGISFLNHFSEINGKQGFLIVNGSDLSFVDCYSMGNSESNPGFFDGLAADGTGATHITNLQVAGGMYGGYFNWPNTQRYGIGITPGVSNIHVQGVLAAANISGIIADSSADVTKVIKDQDYSPIPTVPAAATFDPGPIDPDTVSLTGTTNITSIQRGWNNRVLNFVKADAGSLTVIGATLAQGSTVSCVFIFTTWFCH